MRKISPTQKFKKQWKKFSKSGDKLTSKAKKELENVLDHLKNELPLPEKYVDHPLKGYKKNENIRDCHVLNDLVLKYEIIDIDGTEHVFLLTIKNHSQSFG